MEKIELLGYIAACFTTGSFIPQAVKVIRTGETKAISFWMYFIFITGVCLWLAYGFFINSKPIVIANIVLLPLLVVIFIMKIKKDLL